VDLFLADRTGSSINGYWHDNGVCTRVSKRTSW